jgi:hypothetical protein
MRPWIKLFIALNLFLATPALAAPTCVNPDGDTIKCGTPGAMPVGWAPSPAQLREHRRSRPPAASASEVLKVAIGLGLFFALIALLPEFDGTSGEDWAEQEDDEEPR